MASGQLVMKLSQLSLNIVYEYCGPAKIVVHNAKNSVKYQVLGG
jgi:hypothetical protein